MNERKVDVISYAVFPFNYNMNDNDDAQGFPEGRFCIVKPDRCGIQIMCQHSFSYILGFKEHVDMA